MKSKIIKNMVENSREKEWIFWNRVTKEFEEAVEKAKNELKVNEVMYATMKEQRDKYPKPSSAKNPIVN